MVLNLCFGMLLSHLESVCSFPVLILNIFRWDQNSPIYFFYEGHKILNILFAVLYGRRSFLSEWYYRNYSRSYMKPRGCSACSFWWFFAQPWECLPVHALFSKYSAEDSSRILYRSLALFSMMLSPPWYSELWILWPCFPKFWTLSP